MNNNRVTLIGYVGQHLLCKTLGNGHKRVSIRVATHFAQKNEQGVRVYHTAWHDVVAWNGTADYAEQNFVKGSKIMIDGSIEYRTYPDKAGHTRYYTQIKASSLLNLDR